MVSKANEKQNLKSLKKYSESVMKNRVVSPSKENLKRFDFADSCKKIIVLIARTLAIYSPVNVNPENKVTRLDKS